MDAKKFSSFGFDDDVDNDEHKALAKTKNADAPGDKDYRIDLMNCITNIKLTFSSPFSFAPLFLLHRMKCFNDLHPVVVDIISTYFMHSHSRIFCPFRSLVRFEFDKEQYTMDARTPRKMNDTKSKIKRAEYQLQYILLLLDDLHLNCFSVLFVHVVSQGNLASFIAASRFWLFIKNFNTI